MSDSKKTLNKQASLSHIEQSLKIIPSPPQEAPVTIYPGPKAQLASLSKADLEIADRLEKLRKRDVEPPSEEEMASRLAQLKGLPADHYTKGKSTLYQSVDNRSNFEQSDDLLKQMMEEVSLEGRLQKPEHDIEARLLRLRGVAEGQTSRSNPSSISTPNSSHTSFEASLEYDEVEQLLKKTELETIGARAAVKDLVADPEISQALARATQERVKLSQKDKSGSTSSDEKMSGSDDENKHLSVESQGAVTKEAAEVERIVMLYTKKAQEKKRRKARLKKMKKDQKGTTSDSSEESSSNASLSDLMIESTSESERLSDSN